MFKGFYNLTSGMLSQQRRLDVISNNMTNISTAGFKAEHYTDRTFREYMTSRVGNVDKSNPAELGMQSYILAPDELYTDFTQSSFEETGLLLDFAIGSDGFFAIETPEGTAYTRSGSFTVGNDAYLCLSGFGYVLDAQGQRIQLNTSDFRADKTGVIYTEDGTVIAQLGVYTFPDNNQLERNDYGLFVGEGAQYNPEAIVYHKTIERSNVNMVQEMVNMMTAQRALQSAAQMSKIYDQVITKATTELGRLG